MLYFKTSLWIVSIFSCLLFSNCKIEQNKFTPNFHISETEIIEGIESLSEGTHIEITGQEVASSFNDIRIIAINIEIKPMTDLQLKEFIAIKSPAIAKYLESQINMSTQNLGINIIYYFPNHKEVVGNYSIPFEEI